MMLFDKMEILAVFSQHTCARVQLYRPYVLSILWVKEIPKAHFVCGLLSNCFKLLL